jgi:hypothetical protein
MMNKMKDQLKANLKRDYKLIRDQRDNLRNECKKNQDVIKSLKETVKTIDKLERSNKRYKKQNKTLREIIKESK